MFEMKYDKNGQPIKNQQPAEEVEAHTTEPVNDEAVSESLEALENQTSEAAEEVVYEEAQQSVPEEVVPPQKQAKPAQQSWSELRSQKEQAERERDEAVRILRALEMQAKQNQQPAQTQPESDDIADLELPDDDIVEARHVKKVVSELKKVKQELKNYKQQTAEISIEAKIKSEYPDFDKIVNNETLSALSQTKPHVTASLRSNPDLYSKAIAAYEAIKAMLPQEPEDNVMASQKSVAQKNAAKPRSVASISPQHGESPLTKANAFAQGLTPDLIKQLNKEMEEARKKY